MSPKSSIARASLVLALLAGASCFSQVVKEHAATPSAPARSIEDLNMLGADAFMPPMADSVIPLDTPWRRTLADKGMFLRGIAGVQYTQNTLAAPVSADNQVYVGQRPYVASNAQLLLTADLRQLHLYKAQLNLSGVWNWDTWNQASPKTIQLSSLCFYKEFGEDRAEFKIGYNGNDLEFLGMQVGGSTATAAQGVYAVLPFEVGLAYYPTVAMTANLKVRGPGGTYFKTGEQRSLDPDGGLREVARNHTGLRFIPHGDRLFTINEVGYRRDASAIAHSAWFRAGYMRNFSRYLNLVNSQRETGNHSAFALLDYQLRKPDVQHPAHGMYAGVSAMTAASQFNPYDRYYEARLYQEAPFHSRPDDLFSVIASHTGYSSNVTDRLVAQGASVWRSSSTLTGSYSLHASRGNYLTFGLSYIHGPAITPHVADALNFGVNWNAFF